MISLLSRFSGCLTAAAIGDALGMPYEIMTAEAILEMTNGKGVTGFDSLHPSKGTRKIDDMNDAEFGDTSDDTQLTMAVAESLIESRGFNLRSMAYKHVEALHRSKFGWGKTTEESVRELMEFINSHGQSGRRYSEPANSLKVKGTGNGVAMKIAPMALCFHQTPPPELQDMVLDLGRMTHRDPRASHAAYAVVTMMHGTDFPEFLPYRVVNYRAQSEWDVPALEWLYNKVVSFERRYPPAVNDLKVSDQILKIHQQNLLDDPIKLREEIGTGCFALHSVPFAIGVAFRNPKNLRDGILEAVNAGGDTDTNASIVGAILGYSLGMESIPEEWLNFRPEFGQMSEVATKLMEVSHV